MTKGWLILAHGNDAYLKWAANLIGSIKAFSSHPVALVTDLDDLPKWCRPYQTVRLPKEISHPFYVKTKLNELSPFDHTIYLDSDSLVIGEVDHLFDQAEPFDIHCVGRYKPGERSNMVWADIAEMRTFYGWDERPYIETNSSYINWKKGPETDRIFQLAESLYASNFYPNYNAESFSFYPDELAFNAALTYLNVHPEKGSPVLIHYRDSGHPQLHRNTKPIISLCGIDTTHGHLYQYYEREKNRIFAKRYGHGGYKMRRTDKACSRGNVGRLPFQGYRDRDFEEIKRIVYGTTQKEKNNP